MDSYSGTHLRFPRSTTENRKSLIKDILRQFQHVKDLKIGSWLIKILSTIEVGALFSPALDVKCSTLDSPYLNNDAIACVLRSSPVLETLVIKMKVIDEVGRR